jgi:hypothetical protein
VILFGTIAWYFAGVIDLAQFGEKRPEFGDNLASSGFYALRLRLPSAAAVARRAAAAAAVNRTGLAAAAAAAAAAGPAAAVVAAVAFILS